MAAVAMASRTQHRRSMKSPTFLFLYFLSIIVATGTPSTAAPTGDSSVTFELYDNGASSGGVNVTLSRSQFKTGPEGDEPGLAFAIDMSRLVNVSKHMAKTPVVATRAYREDGELITSFEQLGAADGTEEAQPPRRVYLVADGLEFVWPFVELGHMQTVSTSVIPPATGEGGEPVVLESMSERPRVFRVHNFHTAEEAEQLIEAALSATGDNALKRSTVGSGKDKDGIDIAHTEGGRTSDNAWDHSSPAAQVSVTRSFQLTRMVEDTGKRDGLQIVRYKPGQGYNIHPDYFTPKDDVDFDFHPYSGGSNRFATVFLYLNDVEEGGFTIFPQAKGVVPRQDPPPGALDMFEPNTWQHRVTKQCYTQLAVPPKQGTAALFYSITPDGQIDHSSHHAACPVTKGLKWGANMWIWNRQRYGEIRTGEKRSLIIRNDADETVYVSWEGRDQAVLHPRGSTFMNTFEFHRFKAHFGSHKGETIGEYTVQTDPQKQEWNIKPPRIHSLRTEEERDTTCIADGTCAVNS